MEEKHYLMSEVMEMFQVTRETLKYYEAKKMINPVRNEKGYRIYNELMILKIEYIISMRNLGYSLNEIIKMLNLHEPCEVLNVCDEQRERLKQQILKLRGAMNEIEASKRLALDLQSHLDDFKIYENIVICYKCPHMIEKKSIFYCKNNMEVFTIKDACLIESKKSYHNAIFKTGNYPSMKCSECNNSNKFFLEKVLRGTIQYIDGEEWEEKIIEGYMLGENLGYELGENVYCMKKYDIFNSTAEESVLLDICIPVKS